MSGLQKGSGPLFLEKEAPVEKKLSLVESFTQDLKNISRSFQNKFQHIFDTHVDAPTQVIPSSNLRPALTNLSYSSILDHCNRSIRLSIGTTELQRSRFTSRQVVDFLSQQGVQIQFYSPGLIEAIMPQFEVLFFPENVSSVSLHDVEVDTFTVQVKNLEQKALYDITIKKSSSVHPTLTLPMIKKLIQELQASVELG